MIKNYNIKESPIYKKLQKINTYRFGNPYHVYDNYKEFAEELNKWILNAKKYSEPNIYIADDINTNCYGFLCYYIDNNKTQYIKNFRIFKKNVLNNKKFKELRNTFS